MKYKYILLGPGDIIQEGDRCGLKYNLGTIYQSHEEVHWDCLTSGDHLKGEPADKNSLSDIMFFYRQVDVKAEAEPITDPTDYINSYINSYINN